MPAFLTLVGVKQAKKGAKFVHIGPTELCKVCEFYKVCIGNLEPKRIYEIVEVRSIEHPCKIHEDGVCVVEVDYPNIQAALETKQAIAGVTITYLPIKCDFYDCPHIDICRPSGLFEGDKCIVEEVSEKIDECKAGKVLRVVTLKIAQQ
ncbi:MAG: UPF0179 family protein [Candidatus Jordarchaeum sp.]|uniref:UPF0179 family protein n=1 Tax=Candidatus Jordarchaeum sp. TaxID=2823881 RepID=UPI0040491BAC